MEQTIKKLLFFIEKFQQIVISLTFFLEKNSKNLMLFILWIISLQAPRDLQILKEIKDLNNDICCRIEEIIREIPIT